MHFSPPLSSPGLMRSAAFKTASEEVAIACCRPTPQATRDSKRLMAGAGGKCGRHKMAMCHSSWQCPTYQRQKITPFVISMNWYISSYAFSSFLHNQLLKYLSPTLIQWLVHLEIAGRRSIYCYITRQSDHGQFLYSGQSVWQRNYHVYEGFNLGSVVHSIMQVEVRLTDKSTAEC